MSLVLSSSQYVGLATKARAASEAALDEHFLNYMTPRYVRLAPDAREALCRQVLDFGAATGLESAFELGKLLELHLDFGLHSIHDHVNEEVRSILYRLDLPGDQRLFILGELLAEGLPGA